MITKKQIFVGTAITLTTIGIFLLVQFNRLSNFKIKPTGLTNFKATLKKVSFNLSFNFINESDLQIATKYQTYKVYLNNTLVATLKSNVSQTIYPKGSSPLRLAVEFNPENIIANLIVNILSIKQQKLRVDVTIGVKYLGLTIPITQTLEDKIVDWINPKN